MFDPDVLKRINELSREYERRWGKQVDYMASPSNLSQEKLLLILQRIVDTGESILVGLEHISGA